MNRIKISVGIRIVFYERRISQLTRVNVMCRILFSKQKNLPDIVFIKLTVLIFLEVDMLVIISKGRKINK